MIGEGRLHILSFKWIDEFLFSLVFDLIDKFTWN